MDQVTGVAAQALQVVMVAALPPRYRRALWAALIINMAVFGIELACSPRAGSVSLLADAVDVFGEAASDGISLLMVQRCAAGISCRVRRWDEVGLPLQFS